MASHLIPCSDCSRHFRVSDSSCPFCGASLPADLPRVVQAPTGRWSRAAKFAFGAAAAGVVAVAGCESSDSALYGAPPGDTGMAVDSSADGGDGATDSATDAAPDAAPDASSDAAADAMPDSAAMAAYGTPPADAG